jgi:hypothetical protein
MDANIGKEQVIKTLDKACSEARNASKFATSSLENAKKAVEAAEEAVKTARSAEQAITKAYDFLVPAGWVDKL